MEDQPALAAALDRDRSFQLARLFIGRSRPDPRLFFLKRRPGGILVAAGREPGQAGLPGGNSFGFCGEGRARLDIAGSSIGGREVGRLM